MRMIIVSGLSGSGKSIALQTLEDLGYFCVDNLPLELLTSFAKTIQARQSSQQTMIAVGIDARNFLGELSQFPEVLGELHQLGLNVEVLFLHATDDALVKRYSETRRKHPLSGNDLPLVEAIRHERQLLEVITAHATLVIDTSLSNIYQLRELIKNRLHETPAEVLSLLFQSFGFKNGIPADADFTFDVRFLPNPHWEPSLRSLTGLDQPVIDFLRAHDDVEAMIDDISGFIGRWLGRFEAGHRSYLTVSIGCTGGRHRSVYIASQLAAKFSHDRSRHHVMVRHRELNR